MMGASKMKCQSCSAEIQNESLFCSFCGSEIVEELPTSLESIKEADKLCETGISLKYGGKHDEALQYFKKAISLAPNQAIYYAELAIIFIIKENFSKALEVVNKSLELDNTLAQAHYVRGVAQGRNGNLPAALQDLTTALQIDPSHAKAYYQRGGFNSDLENYEEAIQDISRSFELGLDPEEGWPYYERGSAYFDLGKLKEAIQDFSETIEINERFDRAFCWRGRANAILGNHSSAINDYAKAIQISPKYMIVYAFRGMLFDKLKKTDDAIRDYEKAIELGWDDAETLNRLSLLKKADKSNERNLMVWILAGIFIIISGILMGTGEGGAIVLGIIGIIVVAYTLLWAYLKRCPGCGSLFAETTVRTEEIDRKKGFKTVTRTDKRRNRNGEIIGETQRKEQVRVATVKSRQYHECNVCGYKWSTTSSRDHEDFKE
jgi:tetratricopeptide (TPR) repeat protein